MKSVGAKEHWEDVMRVLKLCPYSWPFGLNEERALENVSRCVGDMGIQYPYPNLPVNEQPSLFFDYLNIYASVRKDYAEYKGSKSGSR